MIFLAALFLAAAPEPLSLEPFMDEEAAANALDAQMYCIGTALHERLGDARAAKEIAADVVRVCSSGSVTLRSALAEVYRRKPSLLPAGKTADEAAASYVGEMNARVEMVIREERKQK